MSIFRVSRLRAAYAMRCFVIGICFVLAIDGKHPPLHAETSATAEDAAQDVRLKNEHEQLRDLSKRVDHLGERLDDLHLWFLGIGALAGGAPFLSRAKKAEVATA